MVKGIVRVLGLAASWAFIYALPAVPIEGLSNLGIQFSFTNLVDMWPMELGLPGFVGGLLFAALLAITGRVARFETMSAARLSGLGAMAGTLLGAIYLATIWPEPVEAVAWVMGIAIALGALAGPGSGLVFRLIGARKHAAADGRA